MVRWKKVLIGSTVGLGVAALAVVDAQQKKVPSLSVEDYIEIQQLVARYPYPLDTAEGRGRAYAANFTADGIFHDQRDHYYRGHEDLATVANLDKKEYTPNNVRHFISSHVIEPTANGGAVGHEMLILVSDFVQSDGQTVLSVASYQYEDIYEKTPAGWKFKVRSHPRPGVDPPEQEGALWKLRPLSRP